jgi:CxxC-x17-CxxC domain-containing protein
MEFIDRTLRCVECGEDFVFSADEQIYFVEKQFQHDPKHCKKCKAKRVNRRPRVETRIICAQCGGPTIVPFLPTQGRPVLCRSCFDAPTSRCIDPPSSGIVSDFKTGLTH